MRRQQPPRKWPQSKRWRKKNKKNPQSTSFISKSCSRPQKSTCKDSSKSWSWNGKPSIRNQNQAKSLKRRSRLWRRTNGQNFHMRERRRRKRSFGRREEGRKKGRRRRGSREESQGRRRRRPGCRKRRTMSSFESTTRIYPCVALKRSLICFTRLWRSRSGFAFEFLLVISFDILLRRDSKSLNLSFLLSICHNKSLGIQTLKSDSLKTSPKTTSEKFPPTSSITSTSSSNQTSAEFSAKSSSQWSQSSLWK